MSMIPSISDALRRIVQAVETAIIADASIVFGNIPKRVYFEHGTTEDITKILNDYTKAGTGKYPLVALIRKPAISQTVTDDIAGYKTDATIRLVICTITNPTLRANDRETKSFKNILHPIFEHLIYQLSISTEFGQPGIEQMKITFSDNYSWGHLPMEEVGDYIDAVDISRLSISVRDLNCTEPYF